MPSLQPPTVSSSSKVSDVPQTSHEGTFHASSFRSGKSDPAPPPQLHNKSFEEWYRGRQGSLGPHHHREHDYSGNAHEMPGPHPPGDARKGGGGGRRWSFVLQDLPQTVRRAIHDVNYGYGVRVGLVAGTVFAASYACYAAMARLQEEKPLSQRWWWCSRRVPITLLDRKQVDGTNMYWYRFALPHSYDYAGYEPISSVQLQTGEVGGLSPVQRWFTPTSHPEERGVIEFVIKDCDPGRMSARLRLLKSGDQVYLGRWMKEFRYRPEQHSHIGLICTTGGASVALQLFNYLDRQPQLPTCVSLLYCHSSPFDIPFRSVFQDFEKRDVRFSVKFNVMSMGMEAYKNPEKVLPNGLVPGKNLFTGNLSPTTVQETMPPPVLPVKKSGNYETKDASKQVGIGKGEGFGRPPLLICAPQSMHTFVAGKVSTIGHTTYWQGPFYKYYTGFLRDLGYDRKQVYKFGVSKHFMAIQ